MTLRSQMVKPTRDDAIQIAGANWRCNGQGINRLAAPVEDGRYS